MVKMINFVSLDIVEYMTNCVALSTMAINKIKEYIVVRRPNRSDMIPESSDPLVPAMYAFCVMPFRWRR